MSEMAQVQLTLDFWRFQADPTGMGERLGYAAADYDDRRWREVRAPADFETCHAALDTYEGAGWFRHRLGVPDGWLGQRVVLRLEGVNARATVYVNGERVGECTDPFLPFEFAIQARLIYGTANLIVVCVDNKQRAGDVPGMQRGWRNYGGLLREVTVTVTDLCYIGRLASAATPAQNGGHLRLEATVCNERPSSAPVRIVADVLNGEGHSVVQIEGTPNQVASGGEVAHVLEADVVGIALWSPDGPTLYTVRVSLQIASDIAETRDLRVGFRSIAARDGRLWLNDEPIFLTGFNRHEDSPTTHMCPDLTLAGRDFAAMKDAGANFVRLCHYPHHPGELDLCDELGLLVMDEIPLYWWEGHDEGMSASASKLAAAKRQLRRLVDRDINHPSVAFWSVSNETREDRPEVCAGNAELVQIAKALDPTRLAVHVSDHWQRVLNADSEAEADVGGEPALFEGDDVICVNAYPSAAALTYTGSREPPRDYDLASSTDWWRRCLASLHVRYPKKPILITEFGSVSFYGVVDGAFGGDLHSAIIEHELAGMDAPYVAGAAVWCWADHAWPPATFDFCGRLAVSPYGVLTRDRRRKSSFWRARLLFRALQGMEERVGRRQGPGPSGYEIFMVRPDMDDIPEVDLPQGYTIRTMRADEGALWTDIWRDADPWTKVGPELFASEFGDDLPALRWRGYIVEDPRGVAAATITAWYNRTYKGRDYGQVHWVATRQTQWGRGIGKGMLSYALLQMARWHDRAFLGTQTKRIPAIKLYLDFGFVPDLDHEGARAAWREVKAVLDHPVLAALDLS